MYNIQQIVFGNNNGVYETEEGQNNGYLFGIYEFSEDSTILSERIIDEIKRKMNLQ